MGKPSQNSSNVRAQWPSRLTTIFYEACMMRYLRVNDLIPTLLKRVVLGSKDLGFMYLES